MAIKLRKNKKSPHKEIVEADAIYPRSDGRIAFSRRSAVLADGRMNAKNGRIQKRLGKNSKLSQSFKDAVANDYEDILERVYLETELMGYEKVVNALLRCPEDANCNRLLKKIARDPTKFRGTNVLCPIWKNKKILELTGAAFPRYLFPEKSNELYLLTVVFGFAENLHQLEDLIDVERASLMRLINGLTKKKRGIFIAGCFEPDLKTHKQLSAPTSGNAKLLKQLGVEAPETGGWILTGHFIVRAPHREWVRQELVEYYPSKGWKRVQFDGIDSSKSLAMHMMDILGYAAKYPEPLFKYHTRGSSKGEGDKQLGSMRSAFYGPSLPATHKDDGFGIDAAIRQWALFMDRLGEKKIYFAKESTYAQKWYSESEWKCIRENGDDMIERYGETNHKVELHRTTEFYSDRVKSHLIGKCRRLQTRDLRFDVDWLRDTDLGDGPYTGRPYSYDRWILK